MALFLSYSGSHSHLPSSSSTQSQSNCSFFFKGPNFLPLSPPPVHFSSSWLPRIFLLIFAFCWSCFVSLDVSSVFLSLSLSLLHTYTHPRQPLSTGCQILIWASWTQTTAYPLVSNGKVLKTPFIRSVWSYILYVHYSSQITPLDWLTPAIRKSIAECVCVKSFLSS